MAGVIRPNPGADADYDATVQTVKKIERELEIHLREVEFGFNGKVVSSRYFLVSNCSANCRSIILE